MEKLTYLWWQFYYWAAEQPLFVQVAIGIGLVVVGVPLILGVIGLAFALVFGSLEKFFQARMKSVFDVNPEPVPDVRWSRVAVAILAVALVIVLAALALD